MRMSLLHVYIGASLKSVYLITSSTPQGWSVRFRRLHGGSRIALGYHLLQSQTAESHAEGRTQLVLGFKPATQRWPRGFIFFMMHTPKRVWYFSRAFAFGGKWVRLAVVKVAFGKRYSDMFMLHANTLRKTLTPRGRSSDEKSPTCYTKLMNQCQNVKCSFWIIPNISSRM